MNTFKDLKLEYRYRSNQHSVYKDFYERCLKRSVIYDRAVGYFTSNSLKLIAKGLEKFIKNNGKIRITTSPHLSIEDVEAIKAGEELKVLERKLIKEWDDFCTKVEEDTLKIFSWLIATNKLEIKIAYKTSGLYHEKFGIFQDEEGNKISFSGSGNETLSGMKDNFEAIEVFSSLADKRDSARIEEMQSDFERLWLNETKNLKVITLPEALRNKIIKVKVREDEIKKIIEKIESKKNNLGELGIPKWLEIRPYQKEALNTWINNKGKGILEMATGTGKTITALYILLDTIKKMNKHNFSCLGIIIVPTLTLAEQWYEELKEFGAKGVRCNSKYSWEKEVKDCLDSLTINYIWNDFLIVTNKTFNKISEQIDKLPNTAKEKIFIIADEVHNLGTNKSLQKLPEGIVFKLGLSATPERYFDFEGSNKLKEYFGEIIFEYSMEKAIKNKFLTPYYYYMITVHLTEEEYLEYHELTNKLISINFGKSCNENSEIKKAAEILMNKRARIIKLAKNKVSALKNTIVKQGKINNSLVYVGEGSNLDDEVKMIEKVTKMLGNDLNLKIQRFTAEETLEERNKILENFKEGKYDALVAMKCLDEGVNIPSVERAYILSSTGNPKEYIQRRGRVLRLSPETNKDYAFIYDFVILPESSDIVNQSGSKYRLDRSILEKELTRVNEFTKLALNGPEIQGQLLKIKEKYNLLEI